MMIHPTAARVVMTVVVVVLVGSLVAVPVGAGDNVALFFFEPSELDVESGETVAVDVQMRTHGGYSGQGIGEIEFTLDYDPDVFTVTDLERGPWLDGDDADIDVTTQIDDDSGLATITQKRQPYGEGATGTDTVATVTIAVTEDVDPSSHRIEITNASSTLVTDSPQATMDRELEVEIDGGGDGFENDEADTGPDGVTLADDADIANSGDGTDSDHDEDEPIPGFGLVGAIVALLVAGRIALGHRQST